MLHKVKKTESFSVLGRTFDTEKEAQRFALKNHIQEIIIEKHASYGEVDACDIPDIVEEHWCFFLEYHNTGIK